MKKRMLGVLLPVVAGLGLAGTGFGAWVFSNNVSEASAAASINITSAVEIQGLKVAFESSYTDPTTSKAYKGDTIVLDQKNEADMLVAYHFEATADFLDGVANTATNTIKNSEDETADYETVDYHNSASYTVASNNSKTDHKDKIYTITYSAKYHFELSGAAATYLANPIPEASATKIGDPSAKTPVYATMTYKYVTDDEDDSKSGWKVIANDLTAVKTTEFQWNSKDVTADDSPKSNGSYVDQKTAKPMTAGEYKKMVDAFSNEQTKGSIVLKLTDFAVNDVTVTEAA